MDDPNTKHSTDVSETAEIHHNGDDHTNNSDDPHTEHSNVVSENEDPSKNVSDTSSTNSLSQPTGGSLVSANNDASVTIYVSKPSASTLYYSPETNEELPEMSFRTYSDREWQLSDERLLSCVVDKFNEDLLGRQAEISDAVANEEYANIPSPLSGSISAGLVRHGLFVKARETCLSDLKKEYGKTEDADSLNKKIRHAYANALIKTGHGLHTASNYVSQKSDEYGVTQSMNDAKDYVVDRVDFMKSRVMCASHEYRSKWAKQLHARWFLVESDYPGKGNWTSSKDSVYDRGKLLHRWGGWAIDVLMPNDDFIHEGQSCTYEHILEQEEGANKLADFREIESKIGVEK